MRILLLLLLSSHHHPFLFQLGHVEEDEDDDRHITHLVMVVVVVVVVAMILMVDEILLRSWRAAAIGPEGEGGGDGVVTSPPIDRHNTHEPSHSRTSEIVSSRIRN